MTEFTEHEVDRETTRHFVKGLGQSGKTVKLAQIRYALSEYGDYPYPAVACSVCEYDRARVEIDHSPVDSDTVEMYCNSCGADIISNLEDIDEHR